MSSLAPMPWPFDGMACWASDFRPIVLGKAKPVCVPEGRRAPDC